MSSYPNRYPEDPHGAYSGSQSIDRRHGNPLDEERYYPSNNSSNGFMAAFPEPPLYQARDERGSSRNSSSSLSSSRRNRVAGQEDNDEDPRARVENQHRRGSGRRQETTHDPTVPSSFHDEGRMVRNENYEFEQQRRQQREQEDDIDARRRRVEELHQRRRRHREAEKNARASNASSRRGEPSDASGMRAPTPRHAREQKEYSKMQGLQLAPPDGFPSADYHHNNRQQREYEKAWGVQAATTAEDYGKRQRMEQMKMLGTTIGLESYDAPGHQNHEMVANDREAEKIRRQKETQKKDPLRVSEPFEESPDFDPRYGASRGLSLNPANDGQAAQRVDYYYPDTNPQWSVGKDSRKSNVTVPTETSDQSSMPRTRPGAIRVGGEGDESRENDFEEYDAGGNNHTFSAGAAQRVNASPDVRLQQTDVPLSLAIEQRNNSTGDTGWYPPSPLDDSHRLSSPRYQSSRPNHGDKLQPVDDNDMGGTDVELVRRIKFCRRMTLAVLLLCIVGLAAGLVILATTQSPSPTAPVTEDGIDTRTDTTPPTPQPFNAPTLAPSVSQLPTETPRPSPTPSGRPTLGSWELRGPPLQGDVGFGSRVDLAAAAFSNSATVAIASDGNVTVHQFSTFRGGWAALGQVLPGQEVSMSSDAQTLVILDNNGVDSVVRVYDRFGNIAGWELFHEIGGEIFDNFTPDSVVLAEKSYVLAISGTSVSSREKFTRVLVMELSTNVNGTTWTPRGQPIDEPGSRQIETSLSSDGNFLAVGNLFNSREGTTALYSYNNVEWVSGVASAFDLAAGPHVSVSGDASVVAIGSAPGKVLFYVTDAKGQISPPVAVTENGNAPLVSISNDGTAVAIAWDNRAGVWAFDEGLVQWFPRGHQIVFPSTVTSISIADDGMLVAIGVEERGFVGLYGFGN